jgi:hypothetical protein
MKVAAAQAVGWWQGAVLITEYTVYRNIEKEN